MCFNLYRTITGDRTNRDKLSYQQILGSKSLLVWGKQVHPTSAGYIFNLISSRFEIFIIASSFFPHCHIQANISTSIMIFNTLIL